MSSPLVGLVVLRRMLQSARVEREDRRSHNNETVILLTKTIKWFIVLSKHITYLGYNYPCRWYRCRGRQSSSATEDGGLTIAARHKLAAWPRSESGRRRCTSAIAESRKPSLSHGRSGRYGEGDRF